MRLIWDEQSAVDLEEIWEHIAQDSVAAANGVFARLRTGVDHLTNHPEMGRRGRVEGTREFVYSDLPYIAVYVVSETRHTVTIMRIVHTARFYPPRPKH